MHRLTRETIFESGHLGQNLAQKSVRGGMATMGAQVVSLVLQTTGTVVLARLLTPNDYGLIGMVAVVIGFAGMFADAGLSAATVQRESITHEQISTLFWINLCISAVLGVCVLVGAPLVALFYGKPELTAVTAALSLPFFIGGLTIQHRALLGRHMRFGIQAFIGIATQVVSLGATIGLALLGWRYWALVGGSVASPVISGLLVFWFCPWIPGRTQKGTGVRQMLRFGGNLTGFDFFNYFARNADNALVGKFLGADALGLYARAYNLFMMPISQIRGPLTGVAFPVLSSLQNQPDRYRTYYRHLLDIIASTTIPLTVYCIIEAEFIIQTLLGSQWLGAVPVFRLLAVAGLFQAAVGTTGVVMMSSGQTSRYFRWGIVGAVVYVSSFVVGLPFGVTGVAASYAATSILMLLPTMIYSFRNTPVSVGLCVEGLYPPLLASGAAAGIAMPLAHAVPQGPILAHGILLVVFAGIVIFATCLRPALRADLCLFVKKMFPGTDKGLAAADE